jgi:glycosyltransferase involved in cell wall biosynthesis
MYKISIIMTYPSRKPIGGYKILYEYAKRLSACGYKINFYYEFGICYNFTLFSRLKLFIKFLFFIFYPFWKWFDFDNNHNSKKIHHIVKWKLSSNDLSNCDLIFASSVETAHIIKKIAPQKPVIYFIQAFEKWNISENNVKNTYQFNNFYNIVVSKWLRDKVEEVGRVFLYLPNAIDHQKFKLYKNISSKERKNTILMMFSNHEWKGSDLGIKAILKIKEIFPEISAVIFGTAQRPKRIPKWVKYEENPSQSLLCKLYNNSQIFLCTSYEEGFSLPPAEAMACGCSIVTTNCGGVLDFCIHNETSLIADDHTSDSLVKSIEVLIKNEDLRVRLAKNGSNFICKFNWDNNIQKFKEGIEKIYS